MFFTLNTFIFSVFWEFWQQVQDLNLVLQKESQAIVFNPGHGLEKFLHMVTVLVPSYNLFGRGSVSVQVFDGRIAQEVSEVDVVWRLVEDSLHDSKHLVLGC